VGGSGRKQGRLCGVKRSGQGHICEESGGAGRATLVRSQEEQAGPRLLRTMRPLSHVQVCQATILLGALPIHMHGDDCLAILFGNPRSAPALPALTRCLHQGNIAARQALLPSSYIRRTDCRPGAYAPHALVQHLHTGRGFRLSCFLQCVQRTWSSVYQ